MIIEELFLGDPGWGVKILTFRGSRKLTLFYRVSIENPQFGGQKSKLCKDNFRGEFPPPPSSVRYVLTPPYPGLRISVMQLSIRT